MSLRNRQPSLSSSEFASISQEQPSVHDTGYSKPVHRRTLFLSHANPEDNAFARWLATQLAIAGYEVWCDLTQLLGGEKFWNDINEAIDGHTYRFLFASTLESNRKPGTLRELNLASQAELKHDLKDFIIPLKVDDFPFASAHPSIRERNFIRFDDNWSAGLAQLLSLLDRHEAPKATGSGADAVSAWYEKTLDENRRIVISNEIHYSNWFSLDLPRELFFHQTSLTPGQLRLASDPLKFPHRCHEGTIVSFAKRNDVQDALENILQIRQTNGISVTSFLQDGNSNPAIKPFDAHNIVSDLIRQAWDRELANKDMRFYELASGLRAWFFRNEQIPSNKAYFVPPSGTKRTYRQLVGRKSKRTIDGLKVRDGYWHFAFSASSQLTPFPRIVLRNHVIFTDDGETPWTSTTRMHRARRRVCKNWWNREWRDRLFAMCAAISSTDHCLTLKVGRDVHIEVAMAPETFTNPWTYFEDGQMGLDETADVELIKEETCRDDDDEMVQDTHLHDDLGSNDNG